MSLLYLLACHMYTLDKIPTLPTCYHSALVMIQHLCDTKICWWCQLVSALVSVNSINRGGY